MLKSPLRFPGGKSRAIGQILPIVPDFEEYREPMVGGGSVFLAVRQRFPNRRYWINDLNYELYCFWKVAQERAYQLADALHQLRAETQNGKALFYRLLDRYGQGDEFERAVRFFALNRMTFSGTVDSGGYSEQAFRGRFTSSAIERVRRLEPLLQGVQITHGDSELVVRAEGAGVFLFLDPPYYSATDSRLYGKRGELHTGFDHHRLMRVLRETPHRWLLTYDDSPFIRDLYAEYTQVRWTLQYGMNNYKQLTARAGEELFIANYPIQSRGSAQLCLVFERRMREYAP
ncbi:MAG: DNA adenine methylase [Chloracidobacterium sp.]|nr:DNA adenine methylase [Chloracidobacterium sp.]MDW8218104.1 DNA adenine methylase [Acidobacteriota bacterium]